MKPQIILIIKLHYFKMTEIITNICNKYKIIISEHNKITILIIAV